MVKNFGWLVALALCVAMVGCTQQAEETDPKPTEPVKTQEPADQPAGQVTESAVYKLKIDGMM